MCEWPRTSGDGGGGGRQRWEERALLLVAVAMRSNVGKVHRVPPAQPVRASERASESKEAGRKQKKSVDGAIVFFPLCFSFIPTFTGNITSIYV